MSGHVTPPVMGLSWLRATGTTYIKPKKYLEIPGPRRGHGINKHPRRSTRKRNIRNYDESTYNVGDDVRVKFKHNNGCFHDHDGTITSVCLSDEKPSVHYYIVIFHSDDETWKCYLDGDTLKACVDGKQDTAGS